jgi:predicted transcriptional regulator
VIFMDQEELDLILQVIENPVRRKIIKRLSQAPCYALQLSKELGLGQPLVAKHLGIMEKGGLVTSMSEISPAGPPRKKYSLAKGVTITMDVGPNVFIERGTVFEARTRGKVSQEIVQLRKKLGDAKGAGDDRRRLTLLSVVLANVDKRMEGIESERAELLDIRNHAMKEAAQIANKLTGLDTRRVLFHILDEHDMGVESISEALNLREFSVKAILEELGRNYFE